MKNRKFPVIFDKLIKTYFRINPITQTEDTRMMITETRKQLHSTAQQRNRAQFVRFHCLELTRPNEQQRRTMPNGFGCCLLSAG